MTLTIALTLFFALLVLALSPGVGMFTVASRTSSYGLLHGVVTVLGIICADFVFVTFALFGLATLSGVWGHVFEVIKYAGAAYLVWLGISLMRSENTSEIPDDHTAVLWPENKDRKKLLASYTTGLIVTLSNPKAILFYISFFPNLLNLDALNAIDIALLYVIVALGIGSVMLSIAVAVNKAQVSLSSLGGRPWFKYITGGVLVAIGVFVAVRS